MHHVALTHPPLIPTTYRKGSTVFQLAALLISLSAAAATNAATDNSPTITGNDGWYFFRYERLEPQQQSSIDTIASLLKKANRLFSEDGIRVVFSVTPLKMKLYPEYLPRDFQVIPEMSGNHARFVRTLKESGLVVAEQETAFLAQIKSTPTTLLYLKQDSHWTPSGALAAAETIAETIKQSPAEKALLDTIAPVSYKLVRNPTLVVSRARDLIQKLPKDAPIPGPESVSGFAVSRADGKQAALQGDSEAPPITLIGSSFVARSTQFPNAVRYALQRDVLDISIPGHQGPWIGMETYLNDASFIAAKPKMIIWELPERDLPNPPNSPWRESTYQRDNLDWLLRAATALSGNCLPADNPVAVSTKAISPPPGKEAGGLLISESSDTSAIVFQFERPIKPGDYFTADASLREGGNFTFEATTAAGKIVRWSTVFPDNGKIYPLKTNVAPSLGEVKTLTLLPGEAKQLRLTNPRLCQLGKPWLFD